MANIPTGIDAQLESDLGRGLNIPQGGAEAFGMAGRHVAQQVRVATEGVANVANQIHQHDVQQDSASVETDKASTLDPLTQGIDNALKSAPQGKEHDVLDAYLSGPGSALLDKIGADATTREGQERATTARAELRSYAFRYGHSSVSIISGVNVKNAINSGANVYAQAAGAGTMSLADARANTQALVDSSVKSAPDLSAEDQARVRDSVTAAKMHDIDASYGKGLAERDPVALGVAIASGQLPNLTGEETDALKDHAMTFNRAQIDFAQSQQKKQADDTLAQAYASVGLDGNGNMILTPQFIQGRDQYAHSPGAEAGKIESSLKLVQQVQRDQADGKAITTDPRTFADFAKRATLPPGDPHALSFSDIDNARISGALSDRDWKMYHETLEDLDKDPVKKSAYGEFEKVMGALKGVITKSNPMAGLFDAPGDQRYSEFIVAAQSQFDAAYKQGPGAYHKFLESDALGKLAVRYGNLPAPSAQQGGAIAPHYVAPPTAPSTKRNAGESAADFLKRTGH